MTKPHSDTQRAPTIEDLEDQVHAEAQKEVREEKDGEKPLLKKVISWVSRMAGRAMDVSTNLGLPAGVSLDDYKTITKMYEKILDAKRGGKIVKGKDWMRIVKDNPGEEKTFEEIVTSNSHGEVFNTRTDILEFLLERYLPNAMADESMARHIRTYFMFDLNIISYMA